MKIIKTNSLAILSLLFMVFFAISCSKDDPAEDIRNYETLSFDSEEVIALLPDKLKSSDDSYAQQAVDYVESALDYSSFAHAFTPPDNASKIGKKASESYSWSWNYGMYGNLTMIWTYSDDASKNYWDVDIQLNDSPKYSYVDAWEYKNGSGGELVYNFAWVCALEEEEECEDAYWKYTWSKDASGNFEFNYIVDSSEDEYEAVLKYQTMVNADGSGSVDYYLEDQLFYHMEWDAIGNGSWIYYFGDFSQSGSWTVD